jgi:hypothetical protein
MPKKDTGVAGKAVTYKIPDPAGGVRLETFIPWTLVKRGVKKQVITSIDVPREFLAEARMERQERKEARDTPLLRALGLAHYWQKLLDEGKFPSITEIAETEGIDLGRASRIARLTRLAPEIVEACLLGNEERLTLENLSRRGLPVGWVEQRLRLLALNAAHLIS